MRGTLGLLLLVLAAAPGPKPPQGGRCNSDADCKAPRKCGCGVRVSCSYMNPGSFYYRQADGGGAPHPQPSRCMTDQEALDALAARPTSLVLGVPGCDAGCVPTIPDCQSDKECPKGQICVCRKPECSVQKTVWPEGPALEHPPYSTKGCMPPPAPDSKTTY